MIKHSFILNCDILPNLTLFDNYILERVVSQQSCMFIFISLLERFKGNYNFNYAFIFCKQALKESLKYKQMLKDMRDFWVLLLTIFMTPYLDLILLSWKSCKNLVTTTKWSKFFGYNLSLFYNCGSSIMIRFSSLLTLWSIIWDLWNVSGLVVTVNQLSLKFWWIYCDLKVFNVELF